MRQIWDLGVLKFFGYMCFAGTVILADMHFFRVDLGLFQPPSQHQNVFNYPIPQWALSKVHTADSFQASIQGLKAMFSGPGAGLFQLANSLVPG